MPSRTSSAGTLNPSSASPTCSARVLVLRLLAKVGGVRMFVIRRSSHAVLAFGLWQFLRREVSPCRPVDLSLRHVRCRCLKRLLGDQSGWSHDLYRGRWEYTS